MRKGVRAVLIKFQVELTQRFVTVVEHQITVELFLVVHTVDYQDATPTFVDVRQDSKEPG